MMQGSWQIKYNEPDQQKVPKNNKQFNVFGMITENIEFLKLYQDMSRIYYYDDCVINCFSVCSNCVQCDLIQKLQNFQYLFEQSINYNLVNPISKNIFKEVSIRCNGQQSSEFLKTLKRITCISQRYRDKYIQQLHNLNIIGVGLQQEHISIINNIKQFTNIMYLKQNGTLIYKIIDSNMNYVANLNTTLEYANKYYYYILYLEALINNIQYYIEFQNGYFYKITILPVIKQVIYNQFDQNNKEEIKQEQEECEVYEEQYQQQKVNHEVQELYKQNELYKKSQEIFETICDLLNNDYTVSHHFKQQLYRKEFSINEIQYNVQVTDWKEFILLMIETKGTHITQIRQINNNIIAVRITYQLQQFQRQHNIVLGFKGNAVTFITCYPDN